MEGFRSICQWVEDPRDSNATKHDLTEMLVIALLATLAGMSSCSAFARYVVSGREPTDSGRAIKGRS